jgi:hypothetical protein
MDPTKEDRPAGKPSDLKVVDTTTTTADYSSSIALAEKNDDITSPVADPVYPLPPLYPVPPGGLSHNRVEQRHMDMLAASGITPEHIERRGYMTVTTETHGFGITKIVKPGRRTPGLMIPLLRKDGSTWGYQYRPDNPRVNADGKVIKYETPWQQPNGLDVPPGVGPQLDDPSIPLWITEGIKKVDCGAVNGLCIVGLIGVWNWLHTNTAGGKVAIPDWRDVALNGRRVIIAFDGDIARKKQVQQAAHALAGYLAQKGAKVEYLHLPDSDDKTGLDDYLAEHTVEELWRLVKPHQPAMRDERKVIEQAAAAKPPAEPVDGAILIDDVKEWFERFIGATDYRDHCLMTVWTLHTHLVNELHTTPRLQIDSITPESGKTTVLEHMKWLCLNPVQTALLSSPALLPRMLNDKMRTILLDEIDRSLRPDKEGVQDLLAVLNSGYKTGATRPVLVPTQSGWEALEMPTYAPVVMAGNNPNLPDDTKSRSIRILLMPDSTVEDSDWEAITPEIVALRDRIAAWADQVRDKVKGLQVDLPEGCVSRFREKWKPLKRVAVATGSVIWPQIVDRMIVADLEYAKAEREAGIKAMPPGMQLLVDLHKIWPEGRNFVPTCDLIRGLLNHNPEYWGAASAYGRAITDHRLGRLLSGSAKVTSVRPDTHGHRGYLRTALDPVWGRLGIGPVDKPDKAAEADKPDQPTCENCQKLLESAKSIARGTCLECHLAGGCAA